MWILSASKTPKSSHAWLTGRRLSAGDAASFRALIPLTLRMAQSNTTRFPSYPTPVSLGEYSLTYDKEEDKREEVWVSSMP